jgi:hypothetical protein
MRYLRGARQQRLHPLRQTVLRLRIYIDRCKRCSRATLCYDCPEEAPDADDCADDASNADDGVVEMFAKLTGRCESCGERVCNHCAPIKASWFSCPGCLEMKTRRRANDH